MVGTEPWPRPRGGLWTPPGMCDSTLSSWVTAQPQARLVECPRVL